MKSETLRRMWALCAGALIFAAGSSARAQDRRPEWRASTTSTAPNRPVVVRFATTAKAPSACRLVVPRRAWTVGARRTRLQVPGLGSDVREQLYCKFTLPKDAPAGGGTGGAGGSATSGAGGTTATGTAGDATTAAPPADSGGCSIASSPAAGLGSTGLLVGLGAIAFGARRRRRAA